MNIRITPPDGSPWEFELVEGTTTIGRGDECEIALDERTVSRRHADLYEDETGTLMVRDAGSRYGTRLNGRLVKDPSPFYHGDLLDVGGFVIEVPGATAEAPPNTGEMETRRLKKDTKRSNPVIPSHSSKRPVSKDKLLSWLWVVLLALGLVLLGVLLADYLSGGETSDADAANHPSAPTASAPLVPPQGPLDYSSWHSSEHNS